MDQPSTGHAAWVQAALQRYERPLVRYALRFTGGDIQRARDVVQDTFLRLCEANRARVEGHTEAWLFTVCRNRAIDLHRKEGRMGTLDDARAAVLQSRTAGPAEVAAHKDAHQKVLALLEQLPADQQRAFRMKFREHKTYREISAEMGKSLGTVAKLMADAMGTMRQQLAPQQALREVRS